MNILEILSHEHEIFRDIIRRAEHGLTYDETTAREELRDAFLILLPALEKHEEIEDLIFSHPSHAFRGPGRKLLAEVETQHQAIESLRHKIRETLAESDDDSFETLKFLTQTICEQLRRHFWTEETRLWPYYRMTVTRMGEHSIARRALKHVNELERSVAQSRVMIADYLGIKR